MTMRMNLRSTRSFAQQVRCLLSKSHTPLVEVRSSSISGAGKGLFAARPLSQGEVVCLYPGVYSMGFPFPVLPNAIDSEYVYLGTKTTPSGVIPEDNTFILNVKTRSGGYLDGLAVEDEQGRRLDENPSACGHLINNSKQQANVGVRSIYWNDIIAEDAGAEHYRLPNVLRSDGAPWYLNGKAIVHFDGTGVNCGAAFTVKSNVEEGQELLFDNELVSPVPTSAAGWYR